MIENIINSIHVLAVLLILFIPSLSFGKIHTRQDTNISSNILASSKTYALDKHGHIYIKAGGKLIPLCSSLPTFEVFRSGWSKYALLQKGIKNIEQVSANKYKLIFTTIGDTTNPGKLTATLKLDPTEITITYHIHYMGIVTGLFKPRFQFHYAQKGPLIDAMKVQHRSKDDYLYIQINFGPIKVDVITQKNDFGFMGKGHSKNIPMNLNFSNTNNLRNRDVRLRLKIETLSGQEVINNAHKKLSSAIGDVNAWVKGIQGWNLNSVQNNTVPQIVSQLATLNKQTQKLFKSQYYKDFNKILFWAHVQNLTHSIRDLGKKARSYISNNRKELFRKSRNELSAMNYHTGLSLDYVPDNSRIEKWALFHLGICRLSTLRTPGKTKANKIKSINKILKETQQYGAKVVLGIGNANDIKQPADIPFTDELLPAKRYSFHKFSFNSSHLRKSTIKKLDSWIEATQSNKNIASYKIGNEPFWTTREYPEYGYGIQMVGCSAKTFQQQIIKQYGSFSLWRAKVNKTPLGNKIPWKSLKTVAIAPKHIRGLTFVEYLKRKYHTLDQLNKVWFDSTTSVRAIKNWKQIFPPTIYSSENNTSAKLSAAARVDWLRYWPAAINNNLIDITKNTQHKQKHAPITTNCITGHYLNNFQDQAATTGLNPWSTTKGLGALAADFYSIGLLQGYLRSFVSAADGRSIQIYETEGAYNPKAASYMTCFAFAYGASDLLFWNSVHTIHPRNAIAISQAIQAMNQPILQHHSHPITDGLSIMYGLDTLYWDKAKHNNDTKYMKTLKGALVMLTRLQVLYDFYSDNQLEHQVPQKVKVLLAPGAVALSDKALANIKKFVKRGGILITSSNFASLDPHGWTRHKSTLNEFFNSNNVIIINDSKWISYFNALNKNEHDPRLFSTAALPSWSKRMEQVIHKYAPRTVKYLNSDGTQAIAAPGARRGKDGSLFIFVDPWRKQTVLVARGRYNHAIDLFTMQRLKVHIINSNSTSVTIKNGPALVYFSKNM